MKYLRRQNLNASNVLDDTVLQTASGNIELNPTQRVTIRGDLDIIGGAIPGPEVSNILYVTQDGDDDNSGLGEGPNQAKRTLKAALAVAQQGTTIYVRSGTYYEDNPLVVPPKVSVIGDNLRNTILRPLNGPTSFEITTIERSNGITTLTLATPHGLSTDDRIRVRCSNDAVDETDVNIYAVPTPTQIRYRQAGGTIISAAATGTVKYGPDFFKVNSSNYFANMVIKGLASPAYCFVIDSDAIVDTSPYVQNCSNINGPWLKNGTEWLPFQTEQPDLNGTMVTGPRPLRDDEIDPTQVDDYAVDVEGAGGGMLIDGDRYNSESPIKSMVADAFTQVAQGGIGFHITNFGYMQLVSCFAVFCSKAFYTTRGGYLSISNSVIDFGTEGFVADGYYLDPYNSGVVNQDYYSSVGSITLPSTGSGFSSPPTIDIEPPTTPGGVQATAVASIDPILGVINAITITDAGSGYDFVPNITITPANGAAATANLSKNQYIDVYDLANKPQIGSIMLIGDIDPLTGNEIGYYVSQITNETFGFNYDEQKCRRDVGYILDAVLGDAALGTNHASTYAGLSYLRSYSSKVTSLQKSQTIDGLTEARDQTLTYTSNPAMQAAITSGFDNVINIINIGLSAAPSIVNNPTSPRRSGYYEAAEILLANKTFIQDELETWIGYNYPTLVYNVAKCRRDIAYIIDAMAYDLTYEGNSQTINAALAYSEGSVIAGQVEETQAAYEYWQTIVGNIVRNIAITPTPGNTTVQDTSLPLGSPASPTGPSTEAQDLLEIIIDVVDHGTGYIPDPRSMPDYGKGDVTLVAERNSILVNKEAIQDATIDYLNDTYGGSCRIYTSPSILKVENGTEIRFHNVSTVSTASTALEYVGAGVTYNALPFFGGEPDPAKERIEINNGKCFTVTSDQLGNYRIGEFFTVNAITGEVTIDAENLNLNGLAAIGPFKRNGVPVGVQLKEVSNNANLVSSLGYPDVNTVPTQEAVVTYVENVYLNKVQGISAQTVASDVTFNGKLDVDENLDVTLDGTIGGDLAVNGGDLTTTASTFNLINANATTVNFAGAGTTINIGAATGTTTVNNDLTINGSTNIYGTANPEYTLRIRGQAGSGSTVSIETGSNANGVGLDAQDNSGAGFVNFKSTASEYRFNVKDLTGTTIQNNALVINSTGYVQISSNIVSSNTSTGALVVTGGVGIGGALNVTGSANVGGDLSVNGGDITTTFTTFNLVNANATTVNFAGAATTIEIGAATGTTSINNSLTVDGNVTLGDATTDTITTSGSITSTLPDNTPAALLIKEASLAYINIDTLNANELVSFGATPKVAVLNTTDASSTSTGALRIDGGVGIAKKLYVGTDLSVEGNTTLGSNTSDTATVNGKSTFNIPDNDATALTINEATNQYLTFNTTDTTEAITFGTTPKIVILNITDSTNKDSGALVVEGGVGIEKNLTVGVDLTVDRDATVTRDLAVNGGDITTTSTTFNLVNANATTVNFAGAATTVEIGAATGTTNINNNLDVDGDVNIDGGDLTVSTVAFNLVNTTATTVNFAGAATTLEIGAATGNTNVNNNLNVDLDLIVTGDVDIRGGDLTTNQATFNLLNTTATTVNAFGAATTINIGAAGGPLGILTIRNDNVVLNGDLEVRGGDITTDQTSFNIINGTATTVQAFGAAETLTFASSTGTTTFRSDVVINNDLQVKGGDLTTNAATFNLLNADASTINFGGAASAINVGAVGGTTTFKGIVDVDGDVNIDGGDLTTNESTFNVLNSPTTINAFAAATSLELAVQTASASSLTFGAAWSGNQLKIAGTASGTVTVTSDVTTGTVSLFNNITTGTLDIAGGGASTINIGGTGSTVNIKTLTLTSDLEVQYGGTGQSSFTTNGVIYGQNTSGLAVTAASNPGSNATTSYGILTTDASNVPVWTDTIDGGSY